jgi:hypothetical protein
MQQKKIPYRVLFYFHFSSCPGGSRNILFIFHVSIHTSYSYEPILQRNIGILPKECVRENLTRAGTPLWRKKQVPFYTESSKNSIHLGREPDIFEFSDNKPFETYKNYPGQAHFHVWNLSSFFLWWRTSANTLCICPCNLTTSKFPDLVLQNTAHFQVLELLSNTQQ